MVQVGVEFSPSPLDVDAAQNVRGYLLGPWLAGCGSGSRAPLAVLIGRVVLIRHAGFRMAFIPGADEAKPCLRCSRRPSTKRFLTSTTRYRTCPALPCRDLSCTAWPAQNCAVRLGTATVSRRGRGHTVAARRAEPHSARGWYGAAPLSLPCLSLSLLPIWPSATQSVSIQPA